MEATLLDRSTYTQDERQVLDVLRSAGWRQVRKGDWYFPPDTGPAHAAVRISVYGGQYRLERRARRTGQWVTIAVNDCSEFSAEAFHTWQASWPLTH